MSTQKLTKIIFKSKVNRAVSNLSLIPIQLIQIVILIQVTQYCLQIKTNRDESNQFGGDIIVIQNRINQNIAT